MGWVGGKKQTKPERHSGKSDPTFKNSNNDWDRVVNTTAKISVMESTTFSLKA
jgi:hypothetical protein